jgi:hypothetical protein
MLKYPPPPNDPGDLDDNPQHGAHQGNHIVVDPEKLPDKHTVGSSGAGPCIVVIVHNHTQICAYHFDPQWQE